jgi:outer membrane protein TolC
MNSIGKMGLLVAAGVLGVSFTAAAQQQPQPTGIAPPARVEAGPQRRKVPLKEAMQLAVKQGPDVAAARALAEITQANVRRAWTYWQPNVVATGQFDHTSTPSTIAAGTLGPGSPEVVLVGRNSWYGTFQVTQPFLTPQGLFQPGIANSAAEAADRNSDQTREQIVLSVAQAYLGLQALEGQIEAAREAEKVALSRERDARARIAAGTDVEIALLRAQSETASARSQIARLQGQKDSTLPLLEALVGEPIEPQSVRIEDFGPVGQESAQPWENTYSVKSAIASAISAQKSVHLDLFLWLPSVSGSFRGNYSSNGGFAEKNWTHDWLVNLSLPIYDQGVRYAQLAQDRARLSQAQALLASIRAQARSNWIGARASFVAQEAVLQQSVAAEQLAIRTQVQVEASYRAGVSTSLDMSVADQQKFAAQSTTAQARAQLEIQRAALAAAEGRLYESAR